MCTVRKALNATDKQLCPQDGDDNTDVHAKIQFLCWTPISVEISAKQTVVKNNGENIGDDMWIQTSEQRNG